MGRVTHDLQMTFHTDITHMEERNPCPPLRKQQGPSSMSLSLCFPLFQARFPARMVNHHTDLLCFVFLLHPGVPLPWLCWSHVQTRGTHKDLPLDDVHFCSGASSPRFARPQCWWGRRSQWGKTCHVSRRMGTRETNKLFVVGCLFHDSFVTQLPFSSSWFFFWFLLNCSDIFSTPYITEDCCPGSGCGGTNSFLFIPDFWYF